MSIHNYSIEHANVIKQFGRYPSRNNALDRKSTIDEIRWLSSPDLPTWAKSQSSLSSSIPSSSFKTESHLEDNDSNNSSNNNSDENSNDNNDDNDDFEFNNNKFGMEDIVDSFIVPQTNTNVSNDTTNNTLIIIAQFNTQLLGCVSLGASLQNCIILEVRGFETRPGQKM